MSAVPISRPNIDSRVDTRPRLRVVNGTKPSVAKQCMQAVLTFGVVALFVFGASSLAGHVMVEKARRDSIRTNQRLRAALSAQNVLSRQIEALSDTGDMVLWAKRNGMVAPFMTPKTSGKNGALVASR
jgi:hypothetical protein